MKSYFSLASPNFSLASLPEISNFPNVASSHGTITDIPIMADRGPPSSTAVLISTAILSLITGYMLGIGSSLGLFPNPFLQSPEARAAVKRTKTSNYEDEEESSEEEVDGILLDHAPNWANGEAADVRDGLKAVKKEERPDWESSTEECKLVLVVRTDLGMTKGKIAAQCSHATLACYKNFLRNDPQSPTLRRWETQGQAKVALQVKSEDELEILQAQAISLGMVAEVISDAGRTQIASGSRTVLGIGPAPKGVVDRVTGHLKLL